MRFKSFGLLKALSMQSRMVVSCANRRLQDDDSVLIETDQVERVLADLDADGGKREWR